LIFGTAGIPISTTPHGSVEGVKRVRELGLGCMELEFVRGVNLSEGNARLVREAADKNNVELTCHGPYYINLNSLDAKKKEESAGRIIKSARIGGFAGVKSLTFHAAYYMGQDRERVFETTKGEIIKIVKTLRDEGNSVLIRPELTGKESQFGDLKELIRLSQEIEGVLPCIDFAHYYARYAGKHNSQVDFSRVLEELESGLGRGVLDNMHIHMSGIEHSAKGERMHLVLQESGFDYLAVLKAWKEFKIKGVVISESPNIEQDALLMKGIYERL
jgi:deoxyribonuclease-4